MSYIFSLYLCSAGMAVPIGTLSLHGTMWTVDQCNLNIGSWPDIPVNTFTSSGMLGQLSDIRKAKCVKLGDPKPPCPPGQET
jgi:hypothetical protein